MQSTATTINAVRVSHELRAREAFFGVDQQSLHAIPHSKVPRVQAGSWNSSGSGRYSASARRRRRGRTGGRRCYGNLFIAFLAPSPIRPKPGTKPARTRYHVRADIPQMKIDARVLSSIMRSPKASNLRLEVFSWSLEESEGSFLMCIPSTKGLSS